MDDIIEKLKNRFGLRPLTGEGGLYAQNYTCSETFPLQSLPERYRSGDGDKPYGTAILFLLTENTFSKLHRLPTDEVYHFYLGDPVEMLQLLPDGTGKTVILGANVLNGMEVQTVAPKGVWQGSRLLPGGKYALIGCTMAPGYTQSDFEEGERENLTIQYPAFEGKIIGLTGEAKYD